MKLNKVQAIDYADLGMDERAKVAFIVDLHDESKVAGRSAPHQNQVRELYANALVRQGVLEYVERPEGLYVRRPIRITK